MNRGPHCVYVKVCIIQEIMGEFIGLSSNFGSVGFVPNVDSMF